MFPAPLRFLKVFYIVGPILVRGLNDSATLRVLRQIDPLLSALSIFGRCVAPVVTEIAADIPKPQDFLGSAEAATLLLREGLRLLEGSLVVRADGIRALGHVVDVQEVAFAMLVFEQGVSLNFEGARQFVEKVDESGDGCNHYHHTKVPVILLLFLKSHLFVHTEALIGLLLVLVTGLVSLFLDCAPAFSL